MPYNTSHSTQHRSWLQLVPLSRKNRVRSCRTSIPAVESLESRIALSISLENWMSDIPDSENLGQISIPGTHDTMTFNTHAPYTRTQDLSLRDQLNDGIRFVDIRLGGLQVDGGFSQTDLGAYHGSGTFQYYLDATFRSVIDTVQQFLKENPTETIIMSIKKENDANGLSDSNEFATIADRVIDSYGSLFYSESSVPTLGTARGHIVVLRRYSDPASTAPGIDATNWADNTTFSMNATFQGSGIGTINVQDHYTPDFYHGPEQKQDDIRSLINRATAEPPSGPNWSIDFTSATRIPFLSPGDFADYENAKLREYLPTVQGRVGTIVMDYPTSPDGNTGLIWDVVDHNFITSRFVLQAANGEYVSAEGGGGDVLNANRDAIGQWETFSLIALGNGEVAIQTSNGHYLSAEGGGGQGVATNRDVPGLWETFKLIELGNGNVALQAANGQYVSAVNGGGQGVVADRDAIGPWETFKFIGSSTDALQAANGQFVSAEGGGGQSLVANRDSIGPWETFTVIDLGDNKVALETANGTFFSAEDGGGHGVAANRGVVGPWETFTLIGLGNGNVALQAANGQYVSADGGGGSGVYANRNAIGTWETFKEIPLT
jgi:hypothetical protein